MNLTPAQKDVVNRICNAYVESNGGVFMQAPTGSGKTCMIFAVARVITRLQFEPRMTIAIMLTTPSLVLQQRDSAVLAGFQEDNIFPPKGKSVRVGKDLEKFIKERAGKGDVAIVMSTNAFFSGIPKKSMETPASWVESLWKKKNSMITVVVDEIHSQLSERQKKTPATLVAISELANLIHRRRKGKSKIAVFGSSASLNDTTMIGELVEANCTMNDARNHVSEGLISRAVRICYAHDIATEKKGESGQEDLSEDYRNLAVPFVEVDDDQMTTIKEELVFSRPAKFRHVAIDTTKGIVEDEDRVKQMRHMFLGSLMVKSRMSKEVRREMSQKPRMTASTQARALQKEVAEVGSTAVFEALREHIVTASDTVSYTAESDAVSGAAVFGVSCSAPSATKKMLALFDSLLGQGVNYVISIGLEGSDKDLKFKQVEGLISGEGDDGRLERGRIVVVLHPELLQGHDGFHTFLSKLFIVDIEKDCDVMQAVGRFGRSTLRANVSISMTEEQEVVHYITSGNQELKQVRQNLQVKTVGADSNEYAQQAFANLGSTLFSLSALQQSVPEVTPHIFTSAESFQRYKRWERKYLDPDAPSDTDEEEEVMEVGSDTDDEDSEVEGEGQYGGATYSHT